MEFKESSEVDAHFWSERAVKHALVNYIIWVSAWVLIVWNRVAVLW